MIRAGIIGGTGYGGMELLRWLCTHPEIDVVAITSRSQGGPVADVLPHLRGFVDLEFEDRTPDDLARACDVVFFATPHGVSAEHAPRVAEQARVVDLSGDFRLADADAHRAHYGADHPNAEWLGRVPYGLPECGGRGAVADATLVANPGCHATATLLALWPLAQAGLVAGSASVVSVTGSSGSGSKPSAGTHHPERFGNFKAYRPLRHQHEPEIVRALGGDVALSFVPHSAPIARGIHVTAFVPLPDGTSSTAVDEVFGEAYADEPFVRTSGRPPEVRHVAGTNLADVGWAVDAGVACVMVAIDNLGKGMAGTAVQNANLMFGLDETTGLHHVGAGL